MRHYTINLSIVALFLYSYLSIAQIGPPSITAGIDKIVYEKGKLDVELISEIVSSKQEEVKKELMNRLVLRKLECGSFAGWNFARKSLDVLMTERNPKVITAELLKNVAELGIAVGIAEFYLKDLIRRSRCQELTTNEKRFLLQSFKFLDENGQRSIAEFIPTHMKGTVQPAFSNNNRPRDLEATDSYYDILFWYTRYWDIRDNDSLSTEKYKEIVNQLDELMDFYQKYELEEILKRRRDNKERNNAIKEFSKNSVALANVFENNTLDLDVSISSLDQKYLPSITFLKKFKNSSDRYSEERATYNEKLGVYCDLINPNQILIDLVYDVALNSEEVRELGLFHDPDVDQMTYQHLNKALIFDDVQYASYHVIRPELTKLVKTIFKFYRTLKSEYVSDIPVNSLAFKSKAAKNDVYSLLEKSSKKIFDLSATIKLDSIFKSKGDFQNLKSMLGKLQLISGKEFTYKSDFDDIAYYIQTEVSPLLAELNIVNSQLMKPLFDEVQIFQGLIASGSYLKLYDHLVLEYRNENLFIPNYEEFIRLIDILNNVDQVSSYELLFKFLRNFSEVYTGAWPGVLINHLTDGIDKYATLDKDANNLQFDVESFAVDVFNRFGRDNSPRVAMYFSVGMNYGKPLLPDEVFVDNVTEQNVNFISEKVGLKFKMIDWTRRYSYGVNHLERDKRTYKFSTSRLGHKPIVSDWFLYAYGSGLLYQIEALKSTNNFQSAIYGFGSGITFFNGLDLGISYAVPFNNAFRNGFVNLAFDIKIVEYLGALKKKKNSQPQ